MNPVHSIFTSLVIFYSGIPTVLAQTVEPFLNADYFVRSLIAQGDGCMLVGGDFSTLGGLSLGFLARVNADGTVDTTFNPSVGNTVYAIAQQSNGKILVGGTFNTIGGQPRSRLARVNPDGSLDTGFSENLASPFVLSLAVQADGKILVGGSIVSDGQQRQGLTRLNSDGSLDSNFNQDTNGHVYSLALQTDGKILVGGTFNTIGGQPRNYLARLNADGSLDIGFNAHIGIDSYTTVYSIAVQADGKIVVGGLFTMIGEQSRYSIARLNADGSVDADFSPANNGQIHCLALQADGKIVVGGSFNMIGGKTRYGIARLNADGSADSEFDSNARSTAVLSLALLADGKILAGGDYFTGIDQPRNYLVRLINDTAATSALTVSSNQIDLIRGGSAPELSHVTFESWDGSSWSSLGSATRIPGGWRMTGLNLPSAGQIRARGISTNSSVFDQITSYTGAFANYTAWTDANAPGQTIDQDHDHDGVANGIEYFMNITGSDYTANPGIAADGTVTWPKSPAFNGSYAVQTSENLKDWIEVTEDPAQVTRNPDSVIWTRPDGPKTFFVRLVVTPN